MALLADASADVNSNLTTGTGTESVVYTVPGNVAVKVESVVATITNGSASAVTPEVTIRDQSGVVIARKAQRTTIPAGDSGTATFALRLDDDEATTAPATTMADLILATGPAAFWKLNEVTGNIAADSSGNSHHMTSVGYTTFPPTWGQAAGPPGETSALWPIPAGVDTYGEHVTMTAFTNNFTAGIWVKALSGFGAVQGELLGQGTPHHVSGSSTGWDLFVSTSAGFFVDFGNGSNIVSNAAPSLDTWYFLAVVRDAGTFKMYVNGVQQIATSGTSPGVGSTATWIGNDMFAAHGSYAQNIDLSYAFITPSVVSAADLLAIATA